MDVGRQRLQRRDVDDLGSRPLVAVGLQLAAALDTHWRTLRANTLTVSETREPILTRSGMSLVATVGFDELASRGIELELLVVPGGAAPARGSAQSSAKGSDPWPDPLASPAVARWRATHDVEVVSFIGRPAGTAVADQLQLVARLAGTATAEVVAKQIEQPSGPVQAASRPGEWDSRWLPTEVRPLALGSLGCLFGYGLRDRRRRRHRESASTGQTLEASSAPCEDTSAQPTRHTL